MSSCYITLQYHIISYYISCFFILSLLLIWSPFHSILIYFNLFYFISNRFDLIWFDWILFYWIRFTVLFSIVSHINEWFVSVCPSIYLSVCMFICMNKFLSFSLLSFFFILSLLSLFSFHFHFSFFSYERLSHTHTHTDTDTHIHMNICSFLWLVHITSKGCKWRIVFEWLYYHIFDLIR